MFFTYRTGFNYVVYESVYPHKKSVVFIFCTSAILFNSVFIILYSYYFRVAKTKKLMRPELLNYITFLKEEVFTRKKLENNESKSRLRGGFDKFQIPDYQYDIMKLDLVEYLNRHIGNEDYEITDDSHEYYKNKILFFESYQMMNLKLSQAISKYDILLQD
uniref:Uncharacterized protein n=2 Tax=Clastoptera arizonana TaxID=38151 RepID=A0A1B6D2M9_9HEMI